MSPQRNIDVLSTQQLLKVFHRTLFISIFMLSISRATVLRDSGSGELLEDRDIPKHTKIKSHVHRHHDGFHTTPQPDITLKKQPYEGNSALYSGNGDQTDWDYNLEYPSLQGYEDKKQIDVGPGDWLSFDGSGLDSDPGDAVLKIVVRKLQDELQQSQQIHTRTRSVLNLIQEKQEAQDRDIALLKEQLSRLQHHQRRDRSAISEVRRLASDAGWAVADLKGSQSQLRLDLRAIKDTQTVHNDSLAEVPVATKHHLEESGEVQRVTQHYLEGLQSEMTSLRELMKYDRKALYEIKHEISKSKNRQYEENETEKSGFAKSQIFKADDMEDDIDSDRNTVQIDQEESVSEPTLSDLAADQQKLRRQLETMQWDFLRFDADITHLTSLHYNLSHQVAELETQLLQHQENGIKYDLNYMQDALVNLTTQIVTLQNWHMTSLPHTSNHSHRNMQNLQDIMGNNQQRIRALEQIMLESTATQQSDMMTIQEHLKILNLTLQGVKTNSVSHRTSSKAILIDVDERLLSIQGSMEGQEHRLTRLELDAVNKTLQACQKGNSDITQDQKISQLDRKLSSLSNEVGYQNKQIDRVEKGLSRLYDEVESNEKMVSQILGETKTLLDLVPNVEILQDEVNNFIHHLPKDCSEQLASVNYIEGNYLIRTEGSTASARTHCSSESDGIWTLIQRRYDGSVSFARGWEEYKLGFGSPESEFWMGNDHIHHLTANDKYSLRIEMWDINDVYYFADYDSFHISSEENNYMLNISGYHGNATDALKYSNLTDFSTPDKDNDFSSTHCARFYSAGWWYKHCQYCNLNGRHTIGMVWFNQNIDDWLQIRKTVMKIRPFKAGWKYVKQSQKSNILSDINE